MRILTAFAIIIYVWSNPVSAYYQAPPMHSVLPNNQQQQQFLMHLKRCQSYQFSMAHPQQPSLLVTKDIIGFKAGKCLLQILYYDNSSQQLPPTLSECSLDPQALKRWLTLSALPAKEFKRVCRTY